MNELFPEGSEARVNLQQCVIANIAKSSLKSTTDSELDYAIKLESKRIVSALSDEINNACKDHSTRAWNGSLNLLNSTRDAIAKHANQSVSVALSNYKVEQVKIRTDAAMKSIDNDIDRIVSSRVSALTEHQINSRLDSTFAAIIKAARQG